MASGTFHDSLRTRSKGPKDGHGLSHYANREPQTEINQLESDHE